MKTNHPRGFVAKKLRYQGFWGGGAVCQIADKIIGASIGHDFTDGNRGMAKAKRGAKKFIRSRVRHHDNAATQRLVSTDTDAD